MGSSSIKIVWVLPAILVMAQSCFVAKNYERPEEIEAQAQKLFRTDSLPQDSLSMADISWRELFTDPILVGHIEKALENNIDIRIALQQIMAAEAYLKQGKLGYLPSVNATLQNSYQETSGNSQFGNFFSTLSQNQLSATASWEADVWGKIRSQKRAYEAGYLRSVAAHQAVKTRLIANVANTYYQILSLDEQINVTDTTVQTRSRSLETTRALKDAGSVTEVGVQQIEAQLYTAQAILVNLKNQRRRLENAFSILLGEEPHAIERGKLSEQYISIKPELGYSMSVLENRPDVRAAEYELVNAFELTNVARSNFYPSLSISATYGFQAVSPNPLLTPESIFLQVVSSLSGPVFQRRAIKTQYEAAKASQQQAVLNFRRSLLVAGQEVSNALSDLNATDSIVSIRQREVGAYRKASDYSQELLNNGLANYLEVLTARQNALNSSLQLIQNRQAQLSALVNLYTALGGGWK